MQTDRDVDVIRVDRENTVETLRDQLQNLLVSGHDDAGFPILSSAKEDGGTRLVGYIGANELEHALCTIFIPVRYRFLMGFLSCRHCRGRC